MQVQPEQGDVLFGSPTPTYEEIREQELVQRLRDSVEVALL